MYARQQIKQEPMHGLPGNNALIGYQWMIDKSPFVFLVACRQHCRLTIWTYDWLTEEIEMMKTMIRLKCFLVFPVAVKTEPKPEPVDTYR